MANLKYRSDAYRFIFNDLKVEVVFTHHGLFIVYMKKGDMQVFFPEKPRIMARLRRFVRRERNIAIFNGVYYKCLGKGQQMRCYFGERYFAFTRGQLKELLKDLEEIERFHQKQWRKYVKRQLEIDQVLNADLWRER